MVTSPKYLLIEERLGRSLHDQLVVWRASGVPYQAMARLLSAETRVSITGQAVKDWFDKIADAA